MKYFIALILAIALAAGASAQIKTMKTAKPAAAKPANVKPAAAKSATKPSALVVKKKTAADKRAEESQFAFHPTKGSLYYYSLSVQPKKGKRSTKKWTERVLATDTTFRGRGEVFQTLRQPGEQFSFYHLRPNGEFAFYETMGLAGRNSEQWSVLPLTNDKQDRVRKLPEVSSIVDIGPSKVEVRRTTTRTIMGRQRLMVGRKSVICQKLKDVQEERFVTSQNEKKDKKKHERSVSYYWVSPELGALVKYVSYGPNGTQVQQLSKVESAAAKTTAARVPIK